MGYLLGIDLGTTFTAAAVADADGVRMAGLTHDGVAIPSVITRTTDGVAVGFEALTVAATQPWLVAREFKRRFGDDTPFIISPDRWTAPELTAMLFDWVVERVSSMEGAAPDRVVVTHPATWSVHRLELLDRATSGFGGVRSFLPEPSAAAVHYHERARIPVGSTIAVYDLGGGTFDATVVRRTDMGYELLGRPSGIDQLGGLDFDQAVFDLVAQHLTAEFEALDPDDAGVQRSVARLREECTRAKVGLSFDSRAVVPVVLPGLVTEVLVNRSDFERRIEPHVTRSIATLTEVIESCDLAPDDLAAVLLVGGSSRIPLIAQRLHSELAIDVVVDTHPKYAVAMGAVTSLIDRPDPTTSTERPELPSTVVVGGVREEERLAVPSATVDVSSLLSTLDPPRLVVLNGPHAGATIEVPESGLTLGRSAEQSDIGLHDPAASRRHLHIARRGRELELVDLESTAGTKVGGRPVTSPTPLRSGDLIEMGTTWMLIDEPLRRLVAPGAVALGLDANGRRLTFGASIPGSVTLGFGGPSLAAVRAQVMSRVTDIALQGSFGEDLLRSFAIELAVLQPNLPLAALRADAGVGWSMLGRRLVHRMDDVDPQVLTDGVLIVVAAGLTDHDVATIHRLQRGAGGVIWLRSIAGANVPPDQIIGLDPVSGNVVLRRPGHDVVVEVPATVAGPVAESGGRLVPSA